MIAKARRGELSETKKGAKPSIAFQTEMLARCNIESKIKRLTEILKDVQLTGVSSDAPDSIRKFNKWSPKVGSIQLKASSQETLRRYQALYCSVVTLVGAVKQHRAKPDRDTRGERLASARRAALDHKVIREIAERELVIARTEVIEATRKTDIALSRLESERRAASTMIDELHRQIAGLKESNAVLTAQISKVVGLKPR